MSTIEFYENPDTLKDIISPARATITAPFFRE